MIRFIGRISMMLICIMLIMILIWSLQLYHT